MKKTILATALIMLSNAVSAELNITSFNVKWVGYSKERKNTELADMLKKDDVVFIQEVVSPPYEGVYPTGNPYKPDEESKSFFEAMKNVGFNYVLSESDTGSGEEVETNSASTEWFVVFYKPEEASVINNYFIESDISNNKFFKRVPYNFIIEDKDNKKQYNFVSVHLNPGNSLEDREYREGEIKQLKKWSLLQNNGTIILGDMNIYDCERLNKWVQPILNIGDKDCEGTNLKQDKPYDQVLYRNVDISDVTVTNLYEYYKLGDMYWRDVSKYYSDHHPIHFTLY